MGGELGRRGARGRGVGVGRGEEAVEAVKIQFCYAYSVEE